MIKINFEIETPYGMYRDAIVLPDDHNFNDSEIQAIKDKRVTDWISVIETSVDQTTELIEEPHKE